MLQALIIVTGIALADSINPSTVGPGLVLAMAPHPSRRVLEFTAGAFLVNFVGGALLVLGPGHWLLSLLPSPSRHTKHVAELVGGVALVVAGAVVWALRRRLAAQQIEGGGVRSREALTAGATVMLVELPTALPYFAAIAVIVGADKPLPVDLALVAWFNAVFLAPLIAIAMLVSRSARVRRTVIAPAADWLRERWPAVFAGALLLVGVIVGAIGVAGLARG